MCGLVFGLSLPALSAELHVINKTESTIYRLYAWPSDFLPRTANLLDFPLNGQDEATLDVDNSFDECNFTFMLDLNSSFASKKTMNGRIPMVFDYHNICLESKPIALLNDPNRNLN